MSKSTYGRRRAGLASLATTALVAGACVAGAGAASATSDFSFHRYNGADRYGTSALVGEAYGKTTTAILANGQPGQYADALAANYLAGVKNAPVFLTKKDVTPDAVKKQLADNGVTDIIVVGGASKVSDAQIAALKAANYNVTRVSGANRFETDAKVIGEGDQAKNNLAIVATGFDFPDALAGGPLAYDGRPLALASKTNIDQDVVAALKAAGISKAVILGGINAVGPQVEAQLKAAGIDVVARLSGGAGTGRAETSVAAAKYALANLGFTNTAVGVASGYTKGYGADALTGGPLEGKSKQVMLITKDVNTPSQAVLDFLSSHSDTLKTGDLFGGKAAVSIAAEQAMVKAAQGSGTNPNPSNKTVTNRPELVNAQVIQTNQSGPNAGTIIRYTFDENITGMTPNADNFFAYMYNDDRYTAVDAAIDPSSNKSVIARFNPDNGALVRTTDNKDTDGLEGSDNLRVATVEYGAVADDTYTTRNTDAYNPIGDAQLAAGSTTGPETTSYQAGVTAAPDLVSVGNFRQDPLNSARTLVDFTFDEAATVTDQGGFHLVLQNGTTDITGAVQSGSGTTKVTVVFDEGAAGDLSSANVARGYVEWGTVSDSTDDTTVTPAEGSTTVTPDDYAGNPNPLEAADAGNNGNSDTPDLVSASFNDTTTGASGTVDYVDYTFDEAVTVTGDPTAFHVYHADGTQSDGQVSAVRSTASNTVVRVQFANDTLLDAVGASVDADAVQEDQAVTGRPNLPDEVGVANAHTVPGNPSTTVRTSGPDLTGVAVNPVKDQFGTITGYTATYTFDEQLLDSTPTQDAFHLVLGDGTRLTSDSCAVDMVPDTSTPLNLTDETTSNTVTCDDFDGTATQVNQAVLGTVEYSAVTDVQDDDVNPEGGEVVTGATAGSPQQ